MLTKNQKHKKRFKNLFSMLLVHVLQRNPRSQCFQKEFLGSVYWFGFCQITLKTPEHTYTHTCAHTHFPLPKQLDPLCLLSFSQGWGLQCLVVDVLVAVVVDTEGESEVTGRGGRGSIPRLFMNDSSWSGISARTSLASRAMLRTWFPDRSM